METVTEGSEAFAPVGERADYGPDIGRPTFGRATDGGVDVHAFDARTLAERRARFMASAQMLMRTDDSGLTDAGAAALYRSATEGMFGIADADGTAVFGSRASSDPRANIALLRKVVAGDLDLIEDPEYVKYKALDEEGRYRYAIEHESASATAKRWFKGTAGAVPDGTGAEREVKAAPSFWERLDAAMAMTGPVSPGMAMDPSVVVGRTRAAARKISDVSGRERYEDMSDEQKAAHRKAVTDAFEERLARRQTLATFLSCANGMSDEGATLLLEAYRTGKVPDDIWALPESDVAGFLTALSAMRGDRKKGRILGIETDFSTGTGGDRFQMGIYGLQNSLLGLFSSVGGTATDAALWIYGKNIEDEKERADFFRGWNANVRAGQVLEQGLPEAEGAFGAGYQGFMENLHWVLPYGSIGKGSKLMKAARGGGEGGGYLSRLWSNVRPMRLGAGLRKEEELLQGALKAGEVQTAAAKAAFLSKVEAAAKAGRKAPLGEFAEAALLRKQMAAMDGFTTALREIAAARKRLAAKDAAGAAMWTAGELSAFGSFAREYVESADAAGISREESIPTAAIIGLINAKIEQVYVPGLESDLTPGELKGMMWGALLEATRADGAAGLRRWAANRLRKDIPHIAKVTASEGLVEEPLQQIVQEHGKAFDAMCEGLRAEGRLDAAARARAFRESFAATLENDLATFTDTAIDSLPTSAAFGFTSAGIMKLKQHAHNARTRRANRRAGSKTDMLGAQSLEEVFGARDYDLGVADLIQRSVRLKTEMDRYWSGTGEKEAKDPNRFVRAVTEARKAYRGPSGDSVQAIADAAGVDLRTAEVLADYLKAEAEATAFSPQARAYASLEMSLADIDEETIRTVLPGYVEGSFLSDAAKGVYSASVRLGNGETKTIVYRIGDFSGAVKAMAEENSRPGSDFGASFDARQRELGTGLSWAALPETERRRIALESAQAVNGFSSGETGSFSFRAKDGGSVIVNADDVIYLANGRIGDVGYGAAATMGTARHETWHSLWRFARETMKDEDVQSLAKAVGVDVTHSSWVADLDEVMATQLERYASGHYVSHAVSSPVDGVMREWAGRALGFLRGVVQLDEVRDPQTDEGYTLKGFYDRVLRGELGDGTLGVELADASGLGKPTPEGSQGLAGERAQAKKSAMPVDVTDEDRAAAEAEKRKDLDDSETQTADSETQTADSETQTADSETQTADSETQTVYTAESPADASVPDATVYRISLPNSQVKLVGRIEVRDARTGLRTSTDEGYSDRGNQNRDDTSEDSRALVERIGANPDPLQVGTVQPMAGNGIVWALPNGDVIIGNHRVNGMRLGYEKGTADALEAFVRDDAARRGIEIGDDVRMPVPVFILERIESPGGKADVHEVVRLANESQNRGFNVREQAGNDAKILVDNGLLERMAFRADGRVDETKSGDAIGVFRRETGAQGMVSEDGMLTEDGQARIANAALAALLGGTGNAPVLRKVMENAGRLDMKGELAALMKATPELMSLARERPAYDLRQPVADALQLFAEWRDKDEEMRLKAGRSRRDWRETKDGRRLRGLSWEAFMSQGDMFRQPSAEARILGDLFAKAESLRSFDREDAESAAGRKRAVDLISGYISDYIANARAVNTETDDLFGARPATRAEVMEAQRGKGAGATDGPRFSISEAEAKRQYDGVVAAYTNPDGARKRGWMKAPNGKPTNLTERQWVQVRTPAFKEWFGDWERKAELDHAVDFALNGTAVSSITGKEFEQTGKNDLVDRVTAFYASIGGKVENQDIGEVILDRKSVKSSLAHGIGREKAAAFAAIPDVIRKGIVFDRQSDWKGRKLDSMAIAAPIKIGNKNYVCEAIVEQRANEKERRFYLHEVNLQSSLSDTIKTPTGGASVEKPSRPVRSIIAKLISEFNNDSVSKVVDENGEPLVVYHDTNSKIYINRETGEDWDLLSPEQRSEWDDREDWDEYWEERDFWTFDDRNSRRGVEMPAHFFSPTPDPYHEYGSRRIEAFLNIRNPAINPEIPHRERDTAGADAMNALRAQGYDGFIRTEEDRVVEVNAFEPAQIKSATDNIGAFSGANPDIRYSFAGENGARRLGVGNLGEAERMEKDGASRDEIWRKTGWWRAKDGRWRIELAAAEMRSEDEISRALREGGNEAALEDVLHAPDVFNAYPDLKKIKVYFDPEESMDGEWGNFDKRQFKITLYGTGLKTLANMPRRTRERYGEAMKRVSDEEHLKNVMEKYDTLQIEHGTLEEERNYEKTYMRDVDKRIEEQNRLRIHAVARNRILASSPFNCLIHELQHAIQAIEGFSRGSAPSAFEPYGVYRRHAGEVEARNATRRENMSIEERANTPPWETEDTPQNEQIVRFSVNPNLRDDNIRVDHKWTDGQIRYSVVSLGGRDVAVAETEPLTTREAQDETKVREVLSGVIGQLFPQRGEIVPVTVNEKFADEFWGSNTSQKLREKLDKLWRAKVSAVPILGDILKTTSLGPAEAAKHINANFKDRAIFYRCPSEFGIKRHDGIAIYLCDLLILEMKESGTRYVYDFVRMKKPTLTAKSSLDSDLVQRLYGTTNLTGESATSAPEGTTNILPNASEGIKHLSNARAEAASGKKFSTAAPKSAMLYPKLHGTSNMDLLSMAIAARMALGKTDKHADRAINVTVVQNIMRRLQPDWSIHQIGVESLRIFSEGRKLAKRIREDLDRGVSESLVVKHLPDLARQEFGREMDESARRGQMLGRFGEKVANELKTRQERIVEDAVRVQSGLDTGLIESRYGINLSETLMHLAENPLAKPPQDGAGARDSDQGAATADGAEQDGGTAEIDVPEAVRAAVDDIVSASRKAADIMEMNRKSAKEAAGRAKELEETDGGSAGEDGAAPFDAPGDIVEEAVRKAKLNLDNPRHLAEFVTELSRRYWIDEHRLGKDAEVWRDLVALQFLRKTAEGVYSKLCRELTYSRGRETAMRHIAMFANIPTVEGLVSEMEFVGALINARRIRETQQQKCEKLDLFLRREFGAQGRFRPDRETLDRVKERSDGTRHAVSAESELRARYMRHAMWLTPEAAAEEARKLTERLNRLTVDFGDAERDVDQSREFVETTRNLSILREFGALRYRPLGEIDTAVEYWRGVAKGDTDEIVREMEDREIRTKKAAHLLAAAFRNPKLKTLADSRSFKSAIGRYLQGHMGFSSLLRDLMRFSTESDRAAVVDLLSYLDREIQKAGDRAETEKGRQGEEFRKAVERIYGKSFAKVMKEMMATDERFLKFMGESDGIKVAPTKARAMQLLVSLLQEGRRIEVADEENPGQTKTVWEGGYHDNIVLHHREGQADELLGMMSPADMNMIKWLGEWYERNRRELSETAESLFGIGVYAELPNYFPVKMLLEDQGLEKGGGPGWSAFPKALTPRVRNSRDFDTSMDIFAMWSSRMEEGAQWKSHAHLGLELRGIFGRSELQSAVKASHGAAAKDLMLGFITDILAGHGAYDRTTGGVEYFSDKVRGWTALCALGGNVGVMLKQPTSIPAFGFEIGLVKTAKYMVSAFSPEGFAAMKRIWNSDQRRNRWQGGSSEAVKNALSGNDAGPIKRLFQASMVTNKIGDVVPALVVGQGIYRDCLDRGMSEEDAMAETWSIVERTQQSSRMENQTSVQRRNKLGRMMYQFLSTQQQYLQYEIRAIREVVANPASVKRWGRLAETVLLNHLILTSAYFWMGALYRAMLGQEPPEDELKDWVVSCLTGPYSSLYVAGFMCKATLERAIKGYSWRSPSMLPMESWIKTQINDGARLVEAVAGSGGDTWDETLDAIGRWMSDYNSTIRDLSKIYKNRIKQDGNSGW